MDDYYRFKIERDRVPENRFVDDKSSIFNAQSNTVNVSVVNAVHNRSNITDETLSNEEVISWLDRDLSTRGTNTDPVNPVNRVRVVWIRQKYESNYQIDILKSTQELIMQRFKFNDIFYSYLRGPLKQGLFRFPDDEFGLQSFAVGLLNFCLVVWTYDPGTSQVSIVCWADFHMLETLKSSFRWSQTFARDPMLPVIFTVTSLSQWVDERVVDGYKSIIQVENRTQFSAWKLHEKLVADGSYTTLTAKMGATAAALASCERDCCLAFQILTSLSNQSTHLNDWVRMFQQGLVHLAVFMFLPCMNIGEMIYVIYFIHTCWPQEKGS